MTEVSVAQVRALVADQVPRLAGLPVVALPQVGTEHAIFRIGDAHAARFPLEDSGDGAARLARQARAIAEFCAVSPVRGPEPVHVGSPGHGFPRSWALQTWLPGRVATPRGLAGSDTFARDLARLVAGLRTADTRGRTFAGDNRGGDLRAHDDWVQECLERSSGLLDVATLRTLWADLRDLPREDPDRMCHSDLIPGNLLVDDDRLVGVLDTGDSQAADPALDLVTAWHLLDGPRRQLVRRELGCADLEWERGRAWAFEQAIGLVWYYTESNPAMAELGRTTLGRLLGS